MKQIKAKIEVLSQSEIELVHNKTLQLLERVGIRVPNAEVLDICHGLGCVVDKNTQVMKIPAQVMENVLAGNKNKRDKDDFTVKKLTGDISTQVFMVDFQTRIQRYGLMDDVLKGIQLVEKLDFIKAANSIVIPSDIPNELTEIEAFKAIFTYSTKPGGTYVLSPFAAKHILPMADVMDIQQSYLLETISPLLFREESLEIALIYAKNGHRLHSGPMAIAGATSPVTLAGTVVVENAEILGTLFIIYALTSNLAPHTAPAHSIDMQTMLCSFGSPNQALLGIACAQMARFYGLESRNNTGLMDSILPDFQGGFEKASTAIMAHLAGCNEIGCQGIVGADQGFSMEQLVIDNEWLSYYNYILKGMEVTEESIGLDVIEKVGIGGNFLIEDHTAFNMADNYWPSALFKKDTWENWLAGGQKDILANAHDYVNDVLRNYQSAMPVISASKLDEINLIAAAAHQEFEDTKK